MGYGSNRESHYYKHKGYTMHSRHDLDLNDFEKKLRTEKEKIKKNIEIIKDEVNALGVEDEIDDLEDMAELHIDNSSDQTLLHRLEAELIEIDAALGRIQSGVYGICENTGKKIPAERLLANPTARTVAHP